jgi:hypothetical protein
MLCWELNVGVGNVEFDKFLERTNRGFFQAL